MRTVSDYGEPERSVTVASRRKLGDQGSGCHEQTYLNVCIAEGGDALDLATSDSRWLQRQHRLEDDLEFCYARHGCGVRRWIDTAYSSQFELCL